MKYTLQDTINLPRDRVVALFDNPENLFKWQRGLLRFDHLSGTPGQPGAVSELEYQMGRRHIVMTETIHTRALPEIFSAVYEADGVWNLVENRLEDQGDKTLWSVTSDFQARGFLAIMAMVLPGMFKKQTRTFMNDFKAFAEGETN